MTAACGTSPGTHKVKYQMHSLAHINLHITLGNTGLLRNLIQRSQTILEPQHLPPDEFRIITQVINSTLIERAAGLGDPSFVYLPPQRPLA